VAVVELSIDTEGSGIAISVTATEAPVELCARLTGAAELPSVQAMARIVQALHGEAQARTAASVMMDLTQLELMSSSCFKSLVTWVNDVCELDPKNRYLIRFRSNPAILWQRRSLHVLKTMATDVISIDES
jgi:hypothetical protein